MSKLNSKNLNLTDNMFSFYFGKNYTQMQFIYGAYNESLVKEGASIIKTQVANYSD
jgi:hypothetical protein